MEMKYKDKKMGGYSKTMKKASRPAKADDEYRFNAHMDNDGESAKDFARKLTKELDKAEYPIEQ